jgi:hypothetical protein
MLESKEIPEQKFKVGDKVTFLSQSESSKLKLREDSLIKYYHGGMENGGQITQILNYSNFNKKANCWEIIVQGGISNYHMLECEFLEYSKSDINEYYEIY